MISETGPESLPGLYCWARDWSVPSDLQGSGLSCPSTLPGMGSMESSLEVAASLVEEVVAGVERRLGALEPLPLAALAAGGGWLACCLHRAWQECEEGVLAAARGRLLALARCSRVGEGGGGDGGLVGEGVVHGKPYWLFHWEGGEPVVQEAALGGGEDPEGAEGEHGEPAGGARPCPAPPGGHGGPAGGRALPHQPAHRGLDQGAGGGRGDQHAGPRQLQGALRGLPQAGAGEGGGGDQGASLQCGTAQ